MESTASKYTLKDVLELAHQLNEHLNSYHQQTLLVNQRLNSTEEDAILGLDVLLANREELINEIEPLKQQYQQGLSMLGGQHHDKEVNELASLWQKTLVAISIVEKENIQKINKLYETDKHLINQISSSKRMLNAYQAPHPLGDGIYIDKRK